MEIIQRKDNVQIYPAKQRLVPNFKLCKIVHNLLKSNYDYMVVDDKKRRIVELRNHKRYGEISTIYQISNVEGYDNTDPLDEFDRAVLSVCASNFADGKFYTTPAIIFRGLTGKVGKGRKGNLHIDQRNDILNSITKLMSTIIDIDATTTNETLNYGKTSKAKIRSVILPAYFVEKTVNGQDATVIFFDRESPLMQIARDRKQLLTYDVGLLDVPGQQNTRRNIMIKNYAMNRIQEIKLHKMHPTLTFADIFEKCHIDEASSRKIKMDARNALIKFFEQLQIAGEIRYFELVKKDNSFYSVKFSY